MAHYSFFIDRDTVKSGAFRSLGATAIIVYLDFLMKRKMQKSKAKPGKRNGWVITNNGKIEYTYSEARKKGFTPARFARALDELVEKGFIDIAHPGSGGQKGDKSKYAISDRWQAWGTDGFVKEKRPKDKRQGRGFARMWQDPIMREKLVAHRKKNTTLDNEADSPAVIEDGSSRPPLRLVK